MYYGVCVYIYTCFYIHIHIEYMPWNPDAKAKGDLGSTLGSSSGGGRKFSEAAAGSAEGPGT